MFVVITFLRVDTPNNHTYRGYGVVCMFEGLLSNVWESDLPSFCTPPPPELPLGDTRLLVLILMLAGTRIMLANSTTSDTFRLDTSPDVSASVNRLCGPAPASVSWCSRIATKSYPSRGGGDGGPMQ